jgi:UDP-N-acetyl-D-glucosamine dehydrogenase
MDKPLKSKIAIIGLGYVGLPLSLQFARSGVQVLGLDIDPNKVDALNGRSYIKHLLPETVAEQVKARRLAATTDITRVMEVDAVIICVPTPLNKNREPDISFILKTGRAIAPHLRPGILVVLESTTYPGTTDEDLRAVLEAGSGLKAGQDFHLAFSPEREDPANPASKVGEVPKLVAGLTAACLQKAVQVYGRSRPLCPFHAVALQKLPSFWKTSFAA